MGIRIVDAEHGAPQRVETAAEIAVRIGRDEQWIIERTGVAFRHVAEPDCHPAELAAEVAGRLLQRQPGAASQVDWLLHASATRWQSIPDTSVFVQRALELHGVPSLSVQATCLSFLPALQLAEGLLAAGRASRVLITTAELPCRVRDFAQPESAALLGDGAAAVLLEWTPNDPGGIVHYAMETWSDGAEFAEIRGGGHRCLPGLPETSLQDSLFHMDGERLLRAGVPRMRKFMNRFWKASDLSPDDIDLVVPHQPSAASLKVLSRLGFSSEQVVDILSKYGNCVAASMPMALSIAHRDGRLQRGDRVLLLGTAAGISLGAMVLTW
ncbi:MAG: ketoacyl-ACP synthase III [Planctomycetales bacterium]|nr:ketoacyl-ACP synthase III [Planctomycetales bacterium]